MELKKSGKHIIGANLSAAEKKAMNMEIERQMAVYNRKHSLEIEALVIREIWANFDVTIEELRTFYDSFTDDLAAMTKHYEMGEEDQVWLCLTQLKDKGIDIEEWHRERWPNDRFD